MRVAEYCCSQSKVEVTTGIGADATLEGDTAVGAAVGARSAVATVEDEGLTGAIVGTVIGDSTWCKDGGSTEAVDTLLCSVGFVGRLDGGLVRFLRGHVGSSH